MTNSGFIKLHRKITEWEWYSNGTTFRVFMHLLFSANWEDKKWRGVEIKRGEVLITERKLAKILFDDESKRQQIRTAINNLKLTQEITTRKSPRGTIYTIKNYEKYQTLTQDLTQNLTKD